MCKEKWLLILPTTIEISLGKRYFEEHKTITSDMQIYLIIPRVIRSIIGEHAPWARDAADIWRHFDDTSTPYIMTEFNDINLTFMSHYTSKEFLIKCPDIKQSLHNRLSDLSIWPDDYIQWAKDAIDDMPVEWDKQIFYKNMITLRKGLLQGADNG